MKKLISVFTPCYNEEGNVEQIYLEVKEIMSKFKKYDYEHIFIDNSSEDRTAEILKKIAKEDLNVKVIINTRNFGHIRSPYYGLLQSRGDAVINITSDLQEPPEMIFKFIEKWEEGYKIVAGVKNKSEWDDRLLGIRNLYYNLLNRISETKLIKNFIGFGLYDRRVIDILRELDEPYPYLRGLICETGFEIAEVPYSQKERKNGITKNNFYTLYDLAMLGITNHSKIPLRIATLMGFLASMISLIIGLNYFIYKLIFWKSFEVGIAPLILGVFFFFSINLFFLGILGEYIGSIHTQVLNRPLVIEKERINFEESKKRLRGQLNETEKEND